MTTAVLHALQQQLRERRGRLAAALAGGGEGQLRGLLERVDGALAGIAGGDYGRCLICAEEVEEQDLLRNPLLEYCLCALSPAQQRALEQDLRLARRIQAGLLPDPSLQAGGWEAAYHYEPAGVVGGDYCDLWRCPAEADALYFAVGDVAGKGVAASLLMAHLQASFRAQVEARTPLPTLVAQLSRQLLQAKLPAHYATLACGRAAPAGSIEIVVAGHCPPLVLRSGRIEALAPTGIPVGLLPDHAYGVAQLSLAPDDLLLLYTDGLTEAKSASADEYGQERLVRWLERQPRGGTAEQLVAALRRDLGAFARGAEPADDLSLLALRRAA